MLKRREASDDGETDFRFQVVRNQDNGCLIVRRISPPQSLVIFAELMLKDQMLKTYLDEFQHQWVFSFARNEFPFALPNGNH